MDKEVDPDVTIKEFAVQFSGVLCDLIVVSTSRYSGDLFDIPADIPEGLQQLLLQVLSETPTSRPLFNTVCEQLKPIAKAAV